MVVLTKRAQQIYASVDANGNPRPIRENEAAVWGAEIERSIDDTTAYIQERVREIEIIAENAATGLILKKLWAELGGTPGTRESQPGRVAGPDAGTHVDPITLGVVPNEGEYSWTVSGWSWVSPPLATQADYDQLDGSVSGFDDRLSGAEGTIANLEATVQPTTQLPSDVLVTAVVDGAANVAFGVTADGSVYNSREYLPLLPFADGGDVLALAENSSTPVIVSKDEYDSILAINAATDVVDFIGKRGSSIERRFPSLRPRSTIDNYATQILGMPVFGQSNSVGANSQAVVTGGALNPGRGLMWDNGSGDRNGPRTLVGDYTVAPHNDPNEVVSDAVYSSLIDLQESADLTWGETITSRMVNRYLASAIPQGYAAIGSVHGINGLTYAQLKKGTAPYRNLLRSVMAGSLFAKNLGIAYRVLWVSWLQGESNGDDPDVYDDYLLELADDLTADIRAITGQSERVMLMTDQEAQGPVVGNSSLGDLKAAIEHPDKIICVGPKYQFLYNDLAHLNGQSQAWLGGYHGRAAKRTFFDGVAWKPLYVTSAVRAGTVVTLTFNVPAGPIVLDTSAVSNPGNYGITWIDNGNGNAVTVSSVAVSGSNTITVTLSAVPTGSGQMIGLGINGTTPNGQPGPNDGPRTNIRDSSTDVEIVSGQPLPMYNWACNQKVAVTA